MMALHQYVTNNLLFIYSNCYPADRFVAQRGALQMNSYYANFGPSVLNAG